MNAKITAEQARAMQRSVRLARFRKRNQQRANLAAPEVPKALPPDNLVPVDQLDNGLEVLVPQWSRVLPGDVLTVKWDDQEAFSFTVVDAAMEFPIQALIEPVDLGIDGTHRLDYSVQAATGSTAISDPTAVTIDRQPPNHNNVPDALIFPQEVMDNGVTLEYLAANNNELIATVPAYSLMSAGQSVTVVWNSEIPLPPVVLTDEDVTAQQVQVAIPADTIISTGEGTKDTFYFLTSRAGFDGQRSVNTSVDVFLTPTPSDLKAPEVPLADDGLIDLVDADNGVTVQIQAYSNAAAGDLLAAKWGSRSLSPVPVLPDAFPIEIPVLRATLIAEGGGTVTVSYDVVRSGHRFSAPTTDVSVDVTSVGPVDPDPGTPDNEALVPPTVTGQSGLTNELGPEDLGSTAAVTVPFYVEAKAGEIITLYWGRYPDAAAAGTHTIDAADLSAATFPDFTVTANIVAGTPNDPAFPVYYTLSRPDGQSPPNPVRSPSQLVNVHMSQPGGPDGLDAPEFPDVNEFGWLLIEQVQNGCNVKVNVYENMLEGDEITLSWQAYSTTNAADGSEIAGTNYVSPPITVGAPELANGALFVVPYETYIEPIAGADPTAMGSAKVTYSVRQAGADYTSAEALAQIDLGHPF